MSVVIERIEFQNYRQYGNGTIEFTSKSDSKLSVLVAKNGTGKTTLLNSITWCLYEKEQQLLDMKSSLSVVSSLELEKAKEGDIIPVSVKVTIKDNKSFIQFERSQKYKKSFDNRGRIFAIPGVSSFSVTTHSIEKNGEDIVEEGIDAEMKVKKYFDPAISDFYFFDGEKLDEFFSKEKTIHIKGSIYNIAQVTLLQTALDHIRKMQSEKNRLFGKNNVDIEKIVDLQSELIKKRDIAKKTIEKNNNVKNEIEIKLIQIDELLRGYAPVEKLQIEREDIERKIKALDREKNKLCSERKDFIRKYILLLSFYPRIRKSLQIIEVKEMAGDLPPIIDREQIKLLLDNINRPCPLCGNPNIGENGRMHLEKLLSQISVSSKTSNYLKEIKSSLENYLEETSRYQMEKNELIEKDIEIEENINVLEERLKVVNSNLANFSNTEDDINVSELEKTRKQLRDQIYMYERTSGNLEATISSCDNQISALQKEIEDAKNKLLVNDSLKQQVDILVKIENHFNSIKEKITTTMRKEIQATTWSIFDSMIWKRNTFGSVIIDENYEISVFNKEGALMTGSLSATEQMALAYAFTLAIHEASGKNCPIVIDSPLGRVSDENRENMAKALLDISKEKQIIMLFTPDEYSDAVKLLYEGKANVRYIKLSMDEKYVEGMNK